MNWFTDQAITLEWAGPGLRYPFDEQTFLEDLALNRLDSFVLTEKDQLMAFGQCYSRIGRCHLGRLAVAPEARGKGLVAELMDRLIEFGQEKFVANSSSLFVLENNEAAIRAYSRYGFVEESYPEPMPFERCLYMVKAR